MTTTTSITKEAFATFYKRLSRDASLVKTLVDMQSGVSERKAYEIADAVIRDVAAFEGTLECLRDDTMAVIDSFLAESPILQGQDRMMQLHRLHFGLKVYAEAGLVEAVKEGTATGELFQQYYDACSKDPDVTEKALTDAIRLQLAELAVSPELMTAVAHKLETSTNMMMTAVSLGADNQRFKCVLAMQLYESNKDKGMTTAEAAALACASAETQAIADAAGRGLIAQERVADLVSTVAAVIILFAFLSHFSFFTTLIGSVAGEAVASSVAKNATNTLLAGYLVGMLSTVSGKLAGKVTSGYHFSHAGEHSEVVAGLHRMADAMKDKVSGLKKTVAEAAAKVTRTASVREEATDTQWNEDADPAIVF